MVLMVTEFQCQRPVLLIDSYSHCRKLWIYLIADPISVPCNAALQFNSTYGVVVHM